MAKLTRIGRKLVNVYVVPVEIAENEQDWQFTFIDAGNGKKQMAVF